MAACSMLATVAFQDQSSFFVRVKLVTMSFNMATLLALSHAKMLFPIVVEGFVDTAEFGLSFQVQYALHTSFYA